MVMPTYLLAMLISPFNTESKAVSPNGVSVRVLGRKEWADETDFALYEATAIVDRMSEEYGFNYCDAFEEGVCKSDQASIPQFGAGKTWI